MHMTNSWPYLVRLLTVTAHVISNRWIILVYSVSSLYLCSATEVGKNWDGSLFLTIILASVPSNLLLWLRFYRCASIQRGSCSIMSHFLNITVNVTTEIPENIFIFGPHRLSLVTLITTLNSALQLLKGPVPLITCTLRWKPPNVTA